MFSRHGQTTIGLRLIVWLNLLLLLFSDQWPTGTEEGQNNFQQNETQVSAELAENWPSNPAIYLRHLSVQQKKAILQTIGQNRNESRGQVEQRIRALLANGSDALTDFDQWLQRFQDWRRQRLMAISANLSSEDARNLLAQISAVLGDKELNMMESCRRVNALLGRPQNQGCEPTLLAAAASSEADGQKEGKANSSEAADDGIVWKSTTEVMGKKAEEEEGHEIHVEFEEQEEPKSAEVMN